MRDDRNRHESAGSAAPLASFIDALGADHPAPDRAGGMGLYAWLVGRWEMDAVLHSADKAPRRSRGEIHAAWVLGGRAIQDVWIVPARGAPRADPPAPGAFYGTTLRVYDPGRDAWHIIWADPVTQTYRRQIGRARGADIVQEGVDEAGVPVRWRFTAITPDSFHWIGERSPDGGTTWQIRSEYFARRVAT